jgi:hypothetical protein
MALYLAFKSRYFCAIQISTKGDFTMKRLVALFVLSLLASAVPAQEKQWDKYIPNLKKERERIQNKSLQSSTVNSPLGGTLIRARWLTEDYIRAEVSQKIDDERLTAEEASAEFKKQRETREHTFIVIIYTHNNTDEPINPKGIFLQKAIDKKVFIRGSRGFKGKTDYISGWYVTTCYIVFPKSNEVGQPFIQSLNESVELSLLTPEGAVVIPYKIKDLVSKLEDL